MTPKQQHTAEKWTRDQTLAMEEMLHCFVKDSSDEVVCRVDGYPNRTELFEARVDLITAAPKTAAERDWLKGEKAELVLACGLLLELVKEEYPSTTWDKQHREKVNAIKKAEVAIANAETERQEKG